MLSQKKPERAFTDPAIDAKRRKQKLRASIVLGLSAFAFLFTITGYFTPAETIFALALCLATIYPLTFVKGELRLVNPQAGFVGSANARDAASGELLGAVIEQLKESGGETPRGYRIRTKDGSVIERSAKEVVIELKA
jgi:hypothetical protein